MALVETLQDQYLYYLSEIVLYINNNGDVSDAACKRMYDDWRHTEEQLASRGMTPISPERARRVMREDGNLADLIQHDSSPTLYAPQFWEHFYHNH